MLTVSCLMPLFCLLVTRVSSPTLAIALMTGIMFGHAAWGNITLPAEVFPTQVVGTISGFGGAFGAAAGAITQRYIGWAVQNVSFAPVFAACAVMYLLALGLVQWLVGDLGSIRKIGRAEVASQAAEINAAVVPPPEP
jgi:ACS family hexuronate transporter-like MFS transporter